MGFMEMGRNGKTIMHFRSVNSERPLMPEMHMDTAEAIAKEHFGERTVEFHRMER